jgi:branched-chain amino acid transport system substrate-binding protein
MTGKSRRALATLIGALLVTAGCGSTHSDEELRAALAVPIGATTDAPQATDAASAAPEAAPAGEGSTASGGAAATGGTSAVVATPGAATLAPGGAPGGGAKVPVASGSTSAGPAAGTGATSTGSGSSSTPSPTTPGAPAPAGPTASGPKSTLTLASIGTESGVLGNLMRPIFEAAKAWAADVNARGGLGGHPVRLLFGDDAGDPGKTLALARRMVDQDGAVAFYAAHGPGTGQALASFLEERRIPLIGMCSCTDGSATSPMMFQVGISTDPGLAWAHMLALTTLTEKRKLSILYCRETPACKQIRDGITKLQGQAGIQVVHEAQVTVTQPDYTAEVLAARNAGAEALAVATDNASVIRVARSAHRQNYRPTLVGQVATAEDRYLTVGGADVEGSAIGASVFPWQSPKFADYVAALDRYAPGAIKGNLGQVVWVAGKLMERIAGGFPANPTKDDFLAGLYALRGETLGGLLPPLTFVEGKGSALTNLCTVPILVDKGKFVTPKGDSFVCAPGWKPQEK